MNTCKKIAVFAVVALLNAAVGSATDVYKVQVTRVDQDTYRIEGQGVFIKTAYCYEFATWEDAVVILKSQPVNGSIAIGKIVFTSGWKMCQIDTVYHSN